MPQLKLARRLIVLRARLSLLLFAIGRLLSTARYRTMKAISGAIMQFGYMLYYRAASYRLRRGMPVIVNGVPSVTHRYPRRNR